MFDRSGKPAGILSGTSGLRAFAGVGPLPPGMGAGMPGQPGAGQQGLPAGSGLDQLPAGFDLSQIKLPKGR